MTKLLNILCVDQHPDLCTIFALQITKAHSHSKQSKTFSHFLPLTRPSPAGLESRLLWVQRVVLGCRHRQARRCLVDSERGPSLYPRPHSTRSPLCEKHCECARTATMDQNIEPKNHVSNEINSPNRSINQCKKA